MLIVTLSDIRELTKIIGIETWFRSLIAELQQDFAEWHRFQKKPRHVTHYDHGVMELMPASTDEMYVYKFVNGHPNNPSQDRFTVVGLGMLAEVSTGYPLMISEMTVLTALRTAATSALASIYLARPNSKVFAMIGCGAQSEFQVLAHHYAVGIDTVRYYDIDSEAMDKFEDSLKVYDLTLQRCSSIDEAVQGADIITTATAAKQRAILLEPHHFVPGIHVNAIGGDCQNKTELDPNVLANSKIVVEFKPQTKIEGEIQHFEGEVYAELWELVNESKSGREHQDEVTLFDSVGFALEDYSVLRLLYRLSKEHQLGHSLDLLPPIGHDPKQLFSLMFS
ncbi:MAG: ornithine cyclodeaminase [Coxiellaceae bacterium]|nr:ornithine cyclodeaminase [Coxiellaceae bacterium]|tara:strand:- start:247 stop:1257 length:1011 start_codon:yes stop_codon:yes gene_type:complete